VPWCEDCAQFYDSQKMPRSGECPGCGRVIVRRVRIPWHFKILILATIGYLCYRLYQGLVLLAHVI
jgi:hypothetical protein